MMAKDPQAPGTIYLSEYKPTDYLVDTVDLHFDLQETATVVTSTLEIRRRDGIAENQPIILHGECLKLVSVSLDGRHLVDSEYQVGEEQVVNISEVLKMRFEINKEAIKEQLKQNVTLVEGPFFPDLRVKCYRIHVERIFDNLLNNSTKAIPFMWFIILTLSKYDCIQ